MKISIVAWQEGTQAWRASSKTPNSWDGVPGVLGTNGPEGPFIEGYGATPEAAVVDLERAFGRALLLAMGRGLL